MSGEQGAVSGATQGAQAGAAFGPWGAAIGGIVGGIGGFLGGKKAAKKEKKAYERASRILGQLRQTATQSRDLADPFNRHRQGIGNMLNDYVTGRRSIATDPGYQFNLQEGLRSTSRTMRAQGMTQGGSILAALQERGAGIASQQYGSILDRLTNLAGATPQNAIAGGQLFGQLEQARIEGQAQMAIGKGYAGSRGVALQGAALGQIARGVGSLGKQAYGAWQNHRAQQESDMFNTQSANSAHSPAPAIDWGAAARQPQIKTG